MVRNFASLLYCSVKHDEKPIGFGVALGGRASIVFFANFVEFGFEYAQPELIVMIKKISKIIFNIRFFAIAPPTFRNVNMIPLIIPFTSNKDKNQGVTIS